MISLYEFLVKDKRKIGQKFETVDFDLPSGTQWTTCNIGANKPEDYGLLFQFGRIDGYKYADKNHKFLSDKDYVTTSGTKYKDGDTLKSEDDAAYQATNGKCRMPTKKEIDELIQYTDNEWTELNGIKGQKFISKKDDSKWIFIPAAGYVSGNDGLFYNASERGCVWSSSVHSSHTNLAYELRFYSYFCNHDYDHRYYGFSVRGVLNK